jgi:hypothetical protein
MALSKNASASKGRFVMHSASLVGQCSSCHAGPDLLSRIHWWLWCARQLTSRTKASKPYVMLGARKGGSTLWHVTAAEQAAEEYCRSLSHGQVLSPSVLKLQRDLELVANGVKFKVTVGAACCQAARLGFERPAHR